MSGDALASQPASLDGASRYSLGTLTMEIPIKAQDAQTRSEALLGMRPACQDGDDQSFGAARSKQPIIESAPASTRRSDSGNWAYARDWCRIAARHSGAGERRPASR